MERQEEAREALTYFFNSKLERFILSNPRTKDGFVKLLIRPVLIKEKLKFQIEEFTKTQVFHKNMDQEEAVAYALEQLDTCYRNGEAISALGSLTLLISKKGTVTLKIKKNRQKGDTVKIQTDLSPLLSHNRRKKYVLEEGIPVPFLVELGVMAEDGTVIKSRYDKFRQINRFLEFIEDILPRLDKRNENTIIDFGCGKSYLTFAMYYYLHVLKGYPVKMIGLDLKQDVIGLCNRLSKKFGFEHLHFCHGDIAGYEGLQKVDMVVTLHACDTATDYAIAKAVHWKAKIILSVPCCQHELNRQIENDLLKPVLQYGLLKERISALLTDGIRASLLEEAGYKTQVLEFIDMEHTPKNIMIRAIRQKKNSSENTKALCPGSREELERMIKALHAKPTLHRLLKEDEIL